MKSSRRFWFYALKARHHAKVLGWLLVIAAVIANNNGITLEVAAFSAIAVGILFMCFYTIVHYLPLPERVRSLLITEDEIDRSHYMGADMLSGRLKSDPSMTNLFFQGIKLREDEVASLKSEMSGFEWFKYCDAKSRGIRVK